MSDAMNLKTIKALVKTILEEDQKARNSDSYLYLKVIEHIAEKKQLSLSSITILNFLLNMADLGFPPFESVRRARQKTQAEFPELSASRIIAEQRSDNEKIYKNFAREEVYR